MASENDLTILTVRGSATRLVPADSVRIRAGVHASGASVATATDAASAALRHVTDAFAELGGEAATWQNEHLALTWSAGSLETRTESDDRKRSTRTMHASFGLTVTLRDFALLHRVITALTASDSLSVGSISWLVDDDNPAWREVRAEAIHAAIAVGHDYAAALEGTVVAVREISDPNADRGRAREQSVALRSAHRSEDLSLDPVPQHISAAIEVRLEARIGPGALGGRS